MRQRLEKEQGGTNPLKSGAGGYYDVDFSLMYLRLRGAGMFFKVLNTPARIDVLEQMGHLDQSDARFLLDAATFYRAVDHGLRLISGHTEGSLPNSEWQLTLLTNWWPAGSRPTCATSRYPPSCCRSRRARATSSTGSSPRPARPGAARVRLRAPFRNGGVCVKVSGDADIAAGTLGQGTFLTPQHLQAQDRFIESVVQFRAESLYYRPWGFSRLKLDHEALSAGSAGLKEAAGLFADGTPIDIPQAEPAAAGQTAGGVLHPGVDAVDVFLSVPSIATIA